MTQNTSDIAALEQRVRLMEDKWQILELLSAYGPAVDSGSADDAAALWIEDGTYDVDSGMLSGHTDLKKMIKGDQHQDFIMNGSAHTLSTPHIELAGDTAVATGHTQLTVKVAGSEADFKVLRITANRWELVRVDGGWRIDRRIGRLLDGRADARELLAAAQTITHEESANAPEAAADKNAKR